MASVIAALVICAWASVAGWASDPPALCHFDGSTYSPGALIEMADGQLMVCRLIDRAPIWAP